VSRTLVVIARRSRIGVQQARLVGEHDRLDRSRRLSFWRMGVMWVVTIVSLM
jgi:hypothetical protein